MLPDPASLILAALLSTHQPAVPQSVPVFRFGAATPPAASTLIRASGIRPIRHPVAKKATAAVAGGIVGFFAGMLAGAMVGGVAGEEGVLPGARIGAPIGAAAGSLLALRFAR